MNMGKQLNSPNLYLPLFLASRIQIKKYHLCKILNYIDKQLWRYKIPCKQDPHEDDDVEAVERYFAEKESLENSLKPKPIKSHARRRSKATWHLPPNRYNIPHGIGTTKNGIQWSRSVGSDQKRSLKHAHHRQIYEVSNNYFEKSKNRCNCHKGKFLTDPRRRRPTSRFMIMDPVMCWRNPSDPGPPQYFLEIFERKRFQKVRFIKTYPNPYKFLRYSIVPENVRSRSPDPSSFKPGPGRYELLDDEESLRISLFIQKQQILRFRRLTRFIKKPTINTKRHTIRRHIFGYGYTYLFRKPPESSKKVIPAKKHIQITRERRREVPMFPNFEYIKLITDPDRQYLSFRQEAVKRPPSIGIKFNCLVRVRKRRQLRDNKKIVFGSGVPRFKDAETPVVRTKPPPLPSYPVMNVHPNSIKSKLVDLPERLRGIRNAHHVHPFKFQPIPPVKLQLNEKEVHPKPDTVTEFFPNELCPMDYFKDEFKKTVPQNVVQK